MKRSRCGGTVQPMPEGYEPQQRIRRERVPKCPHCGCTVMQEKKGVSAPASRKLAGRRQADVRRLPVSALAAKAAIEVRSRSPARSIPPKNPRYRLDEYLKRALPGSGLSADLG